MILVIRISGIVGMNKDKEETLFRMRLRRKYSAVLMKPTTENINLIKSVRNFVSYGDIDKDTLIELINHRAKPILKNARIDAAKIASEIDNKRPEDLGIKPFFRLHPPRGGIESKIHAGKRKKAVLGDMKSRINELVGRML